MTSGRRALLPWSYAQAAVPRVFPLLPAFSLDCNENAQREHPEIDIMAFKRPAHALFITYFPSFANRSFQSTARVCQYSLVEMMAVVVSWAILGVTVQWMKGAKTIAAGQMADQALIAIAEGMERLTPDAFADS